MEPERRELTAKEAWSQFRAMIERDFAWIVCCLILLACLLWVVGQAADAENLCNERYAPFVQSCYESHGLLPNNINWSWNVSWQDRMTGDRWQVAREDP